jgi:hypothetical protein
MLVSHKYKFVFVHSPKTGGDCITFTLADYLESKLDQDPKKRDIEIAGKRSEPEFSFKTNQDKYTQYIIEEKFLKHSPARNIKHWFRKIGWEWDNYFKFGTMRNPYEIIHSNYYFLRYAYEKLFPDNQEPTLESVKKVGQNKFVSDEVYFKFLKNTYNNYKIDFDEFVRMFVNKDLFKNKGIYKHYFCGHNGSCIMDYILRQESLQEDFYKVCDTVGLPRLELVPNITTKDIVGKTRPPKEQDYTPELIRLVRDKFEEDFELFGYKF